MDRSQQTRNGLLYMIPVFVTGIVPLLTLPILTRYLTPADYGVLALAQIWAFTIQGVAQFGLNAAYNRNFFKYRVDKNKTGSLLFSVVLFTLFSSSFFVLFTYFFGGYVSQLMIGSSKHALLVTLALCASVLTQINVLFLSYLRNSENVKSYVVNAICISILTALASVCLVVFYDFGIIGLVYAQLFTAIVFFILFFIMTLRVFSFGLDSKLLLEALKIGYPLTAKPALSILNQHFDKYMIGLLNTVGGVGVYSIAQSISLITFKISTAIQNVYSPQVYKKIFDHPETAGKDIGLYLIPFLYLSILPCVLLAEFCEEIVLLLLPESYHLAIMIIPVLTMYYGLMFFGKVSPIQLMYAKKSGLMVWLMLLGIALNIGINIPFINLWGAVGAAWATLIASMVSGVIIFMVAQKYYLIAWEYNKLFLIVFSFLAIAVISNTIYFLEVEYWLRLTEKVLATAVYLFIGTKIGVLTKGNMLLLWRGLSYRNSKN
ncbi:oligosaccharide flippase family protein [Pseudomonadota bacterium]